MTEKYCVMLMEFISLSVCACRCLHIFKLNLPVSHIYLCNYNLAIKAFIYKDTILHKNIYLIFLQPGFSHENKYKTTHLDGTIESNVFFFFYSCFSLC